MASRVRRVSFSKDALIEAVHESHLPAAGYAYFCVFAGVFITAFYSFRLVFMTFHGKERFDTSGQDVHDSHAAAKHDSHGHDSHGHDAKGHDSHDSSMIIMAACHTKARG